MFTFNPLPLASDVGLQPAAGRLDGFMPRSPYDDLAAAALTAAITQRAGGGVVDLHDELRRQDDREGLLLLDEAWRVWQEHRQSVALAVDAETARQQWSVRRQTSGNSPQARKALRSWSQQAELLVPPATGVADRVASAVNDAAQSVTTPIEILRKVVPSWR